MLHWGSIRNRPNGPSGNAERSVRNKRESKTKDEDAHHDAKQTTTRQRLSTATTTPSALQLARAAIARWSGKTPPTSLTRDLFRVSVQARHLAQAQRGLAEWIALGGFSQDEEIVMPTLPQRVVCVQFWQHR
ncbi:hypothetical protein LP420_28865 [Massilia sp. B-10]|nr:hypothetical protein LP420_28865 [Massilia sp. B-10]